MNHPARQASRRKGICAGFEWGTWTDTDVAALLGPLLDDRDRRPEISKASIAGLRDKTSMPAGTDHDAALRSNFQIRMQGTDFAPRGAASDARRVAKLAQSSRDNDPTLKHGPSLRVDL